MSVKVAYYAEARVVGPVPPTVFVPRPKVDSALVRLRRRAAPPVSVPSADDLFALVRAGFAQRRKMLRRVAAAAARRARREVLDRRRDRADGAGRGARARGVGRAGPARPRRRPREARPRPRHRVPEAHAVAAGARPARRRLPRPRGARWSRSGNRTTCSRRTRCRHPAACSSRSVGIEAGEDVPVRPPQPRVHRGREAARARRSVGPRRAARAAQAHPRGRRTRWWLGRRRRRAARGAASSSTSTSTTPG